MHLFAADTAFQLANDRRQRLLGEVPRRRVRRRPVPDVLPGSPPPDAA